MQGLISSFDCNCYQHIYPHQKPIFALALLYKNNHSASITDDLHIVASAFAHPHHRYPLITASSTAKRGTPSITVIALDRATMAGPHNALPHAGIGNITSAPSMGINVMNPIQGQSSTGPQSIPQQAPARPLPPPLDTMRAYRACLNCRSRKSKCDLDINGGRPVCACFRSDTGLRCVR